MAILGKSSAQVRRLVERLVAELKEFYALLRKAVFAEETGAARGCNGPGDAVAGMQQRPFQISVFEIGMKGDYLADNLVAEYRRRGGGPVALNGVQVASA
jgi:hypothetical protein